MPFKRPGLQTIIDRIANDFEVKINGANSFLRRSVLKIMAVVYAGTVHLIYGFLGYQADQLFATKADTEGLELIGSEYGIARKAAVKAIGEGVATGVNGTVIPADTELQSTDGQVYIIDSDVTIALGVATVDFTAEIAGADGNDDAGVVLSFVSPIVSIDSTITVSASGITGGTDIEEDDDYRLRILARKRQPPHGGAEFDYEVWAKEISGVTRSWSFPQYMGAGTIGVAFTRDEDVSIIPNLAQRTVVYDYIIEHDDPSTGETIGIPVTAEPGFFVVELFKLVVAISINISPNTVAVQAAVRQQLEDLFYREGGPGETIYLSEVSEAISLAIDEQKHTLVSPVVDITAAVNQVHVLGILTFSDYV